MSKTKIIKTVNTKNYYSFGLCIYILTLLLTNQSIYLYSQQKLPKACSPEITGNDVKYINTSLNLKVLLVEFTDIKHNANPAYTNQNWEDLFFSRDVYFSPNKFSPDGQKVYGSVADYYAKMSNNNLIIKGKIVNKDEDKDGIPDWIKLKDTKNNYNTNSKLDLVTDAISAAKTENLDVDNSEQNTILVIVYAGMVTREFPYLLNPHVAFEKNMYIMGEKFAPFAPYNDNRSDSKFIHIGQHVHELGHCLGLWDIYNYDPKNSDNNGVWDLMAAGTYNGPTNGGELPAPINPIMRKLKGWIQYQTLADSTIEQVKTIYNLESPVVYQVKCIPNTSDYFLFEGRLFNSMMSVGGALCPDYNSGIPILTENGIKKGILVWRVTKSSPGGQILHASGLNWSDDKYPPNDIFPGVYNVKVISPWSNNLNITTYCWAPNTAPSQNTGMSIISEEDDCYNINLYSKSLGAIPPSRPQNLQIGAMMPGNKVFVAWDFSKEPAMNYRLGRYEISRKDKLSDNEWKVLAVLNDNVYIDNDYMYNNSSFSYDLYYRLRAVDSSGKWSTYSIEKNKKYLINEKPSEDSSVTKPVEIETFLTFPNPLNNSTTVSLKLLTETRLKICLYDVLGREIKTITDDRQKPGDYFFRLEFASYSSGVYFLKAESDNSIKVRKLIVIK